MTNNQRPLTDNLQPKTYNPIVVCGPTATGKTKLSLSLAKKIDGELVSADSRQMYKHMDIGTGKDISKNAKSEFLVSKQFPNFSNSQIPNTTITYYTVGGVKLWLYDAITPDRVFSAYEYSILARQVISDIQKRNKVAIVVGGTGLYIKALLEGFDTEGIPTDWKLRGKLGNWEIGKLKQELHKLNPDKFESMNNSDKNNPRRLIRAIEVATLKGSIDQRINRSKKRASLFKNVPMVGLTAPLPWLYQKIDARVDERMRLGMVAEIQKLLDLGYSWNDPGLNTIGYKQLRPYFQNQEALEESIRKWKFTEHAYARRQLTWFKKQKNVQRYDVSKTSLPSLISNL
jgi:tRNA dimethylallyltransferase